MFIALSGYLLFNQADARLFFVGMGAFFLCAGVYSYNNVTDKKEDLMNRGVANPLVGSKWGLVITASCFVLAAIFNSFLSTSALLFSFLFIALGIVYSFFRIKRYFMVKNLYTGFAVPLLFLIGAVADSAINGKIILYYFLVSILFLTGSIISDLRDYKGDKATGIITLPVKLGCGLSKRLIYILLCVDFLLIFAFSKMFIFLPFIASMLFLVYKDKPTVAHSVGGSAFIFLTIWLLLV